MTAVASMLPLCVAGAVFLYVQVVLSLRMPSRKSKPEFYGIVDGKPCEVKR